VLQLQNMNKKSVDEGWAWILDDQEKTELLLIITVIHERKQLKAFVSIVLNHHDSQQLNSQHIKGNPLSHWDYGIHIAAQYSKLTITL